MTAVHDESPALDADTVVPVDTETSDEFVPELSDVYELVDAAEDRLAARIDEKFAELYKALFAVTIGPDGETPVPVGGLALVAAQSQYLGENLLPAVSELHGKFDAVINDVRAFIDMVKNSRVPGIAGLISGKKGKKGGKDNATEEADGD